MTVHRAVWPSGLPLGKLCRSLLLPLLLLFAQQSALLHELSHYAAPETQGHSKKQSSRGEACELCLAFAQLDSAAKPDLAVAALLADLSFALAPAVAVYAAAAELPSERNRGPPPLL
jgi:hypothetical protein